MKAIWNGRVLADSHETIVIEGNHYFPMQSLNLRYFSADPHHTTCPWKGEASYFTLEVDGRKNPGAAWYYPEPKPAAARIKNHVAFWKGVLVTDS